jgi:two-component system phosphate regulon sensor histidine kinase PhoR
MASPGSDDQGTEESSGGRLGLARVVEARWLLLAFIAFLAVLYGLGVVTLGGAGAVLVAVGILLILLPRASVEERLRAHGGGGPQVWPDTAIKQFAEALPDPCFVLDRRGIVRYANERASTAFPIKPGDPLTFRLRAPDLTAAFERVARGGPPERIEFAERVPTERWYGAWFASLDRAPGGLPHFIVLTVDDLSEGRRVERVRADFVANASHELRTPLASLSGFIETLQGPARDDPAARARFLAIMQEQATRMSRLIDDLLSLSRVELKAHMRPSGRVDLAAIVHHVADALEPLARDLGVSIEVDAPEGPVMVRGERDELIQVFENLVENACKYGQAGKRVDIALKPSAGSSGPVVSVRDHGPGIAAEHLPRLTERFYRADVEASRLHRGTGLGLAIVKHILARHEARLSIESRPGEGALFLVTFPQVAEIRPAETGKNNLEKQGVTLS